MRIGVIGAGAWGKNLVRNLSDLKVLACVADALESNRAFVSELRPDLAVFENHKELLGSAIDAVAIATPAATHYSIAKQAMEAGLDVFVEKPITLDVGEAEDLCALAKHSQRVLMVGHLLMFQPAITFIRDYLAAGTLGRVRTMHQRRSKLGRARSVENVMWSFGVHDVAVLLYLADEDPSDVLASGHAALTPGVEDDVYLHLAFPSGLKAHLHNSWLWPKVERELIVVGEKGMLEYDEANQKVWLHEKSIGDDLRNRDHGSSVLFEGDGQPLRLELEHFMDCCRSRKEPKASGASGQRVVSGPPDSRTTVARFMNYFAHETAVIDEGAIVGDGTKIWHFAHVCAGAVIGQRCVFGQNTMVAGGVQIGNNVKVQNNVAIYTGTIVEDDVFLGPSCVLTNVTNPRSQVNRQCLYETTRIRRGATVGANATLVCGITLGRYAFVAAGAVVAKDVPDYGFVMGVPARHIGWMSRHGHRMSAADGEAIMTCPESGFRYEEIEPGELHCLDLDEDQSLPEHLRVGNQTYDSLKQ